MSGCGTRRPSDEMNWRRARHLCKEIMADCPTLEAEVWAIAQGLAYVVVKGPTMRGLVDLCLHTEGEVSEFRQLLAEPDPTRRVMSETEYNELLRDGRNDLT